MTIYAIGEVVRINNTNLREHGVTGTVKSYSAETNWYSVELDEGPPWRGNYHECELEAPEEEGAPDSPEPVDPEHRQERFRNDLQDLLNRHSMENGSNTPDYQLADYLITCLHALDETINRRESWYGRDVETTDGVA